jgi:hypothetical protein
VIGLRAALTGALLVALVGVYGLGRTHGAAKVVARHQQAQIEAQYRQSGIARETSRQAAQLIAARQALQIKKVNAANAARLDPHARRPALSSDGVRRLNTLWGASPP